MKMTKQEIFDKSVNGLRAQGCRAVIRQEVGRKRCCYRGVSDSGAVTKCAVGMLIPDELYQPDLERIGSWQYIYTFARSRSAAFTCAWNIQQALGWDNPEVDQLLKALQEVHDDPALWNQREIEWVKVAATHSLVYTPPEATK